MAEGENIAAQESKRLSRKFHLHDELDIFVARAVKDYPKLKDKFLFYSLPTNSWHSTMDEMRDGFRKIIVDAGLECKAFDDSIGAFASIFPDQTKYLIVLLKDISFDNDDFDDTSRLIEHELGHLVAPAAYGYFSDHTENFRENVAELFAILRLHQFYPEVNLKKNLLACVSVGRHKLIFEGETSHLASTALVKLYWMMESGCLPDQLTPAQTANLAYRIALHHAPSQKKVDKLTEIYAPIANLCKKINEEGPDLNNTEIFFQQLADTALTDHGDMSRLVYTSSYYWVQAYLEGCMRWKGIELPAPQGEYWDSVRQKIKERDEVYKSTPQGLFNDKLDYLQALGKFDAPTDQDPDKILDPISYESSENQALIKKNREAYMRQALQTLPRVAAIYKPGCF